ncbi:hypothetical protein [Sanyastnella coralliicola]|uniref:hypothetical protein n=1 Tax=Sanyastnella coralliicola TaxID=3069118 RepID=UPI0027B9D87D|nr:hypothetical protein [Longitalea sp. SCSIO 12813]
MKKITSTPALAMVLAMAMFITVGTGCKRKKEVEDPKPAGEVLINEYCTGDSYMSDNKTFRAAATGESQSRETAKKISRSNAEDEIARTISATLQAVTDNYVNSTKFNNKEEVTETFNNLARTVVDQQLRGAITICDKLTQKPNGNYVSYIAIELSGEDIASAYNEGLQKDEKIKADYNYEKFKETFEAEMEKLGNQ